MNKFFIIQKLFEIFNAVIARLGGCVAIIAEKWDERRSRIASSKIQMKANRCLI
jgi:hypothetical protein